MMGIPGVPLWLHPRPNPSRPFGSENAATGSCRYSCSSASAKSFADVWKRIRMIGKARGGRGMGVVRGFGWKGVNMAHLLRFRTTAGVLVCWVGLGLFCVGGLGQQAKAPAERAGAAAPKPCRLLADMRLAEPLGAIVAEYTRLTGTPVTVSFLSAAEVGELVGKKAAAADVVLCMPKDKDGETPVSSLPGAKKVAWKHPSAVPVWAAALTDRPEMAAFVRFAGGPTGHRLWSESKAGFTITSGKNHAEAFEWVVENRVKHTYPLTAMRILAECGGIKEGLCIDIGCGTGNLDVEIAKRSGLTIVGLDIDPDMKPLFEKRVREAGFEKRVSFVVGDAQKLPFPDNHADAIISRGTLTFIPDIPKCLREVHRVLKPTGVAFLGGRYLYTPQKYKVSTEKLRDLVAKSGVPGATVIDSRGQWVKILGAKAPSAAAKSGLGPHMLAGRFIADYGIAKGKCLLICGSDGGLQQALQRGFTELTDMEITALYSSKKVADEAAERIRKAKLADRIRCEVGSLASLPFEGAGFDAIVGVGPVLVFQKDKAKAMRELHRVLRNGGAAMVGGKFLHMPASRKVSSEALRKIAAETGISSIRVIDNMGQWVEVRKGVRDRD